MTIKVGTVVMLRIPPEHSAYGTVVPNGIIGEVVDGSLFAGEIPTDEVAVDFPSHPSETVSKLWRTPVRWLIPISGPDIDVGCDEEIKKPVEDIV